MRTLCAPALIGKLRFTSLTLVFLSTFTLSTKVHMEVMGLALFALALKKTGELTLAPSVGVQTTAPDVPETLHVAPLTVTVTPALYTAPVLSHAWMRTTCLPAFKERLSSTRLVPVALFTTTSST